MRKTLLLCVLALSVHSGNTLASTSSLRCGHDLVSVGDYRLQVRNRCGDPAEVESWVEYRVISGPYEYDPFRRRRDYPSLDSIPPGQEKAYIPVQIEQWIYNFGPRRFMQLLRFENGVLQDIRSLGYGY